MARGPRVCKCSVSEDTSIAGPLFSDSKTPSNAMKKTEAWASRELLSSSLCSLSSQTCCFLPVSRPSVHPLLGTALVFTFLSSLPLSSPKVGGSEPHRDNPEHSCSLLFFGAKVREQVTGCSDLASWLSGSVIRNRSKYISSRFLVPLRAHVGLHMN